MYPGFQTVIFFLISGAFLNHEHGLFHLRYFENGLLVQGSMDKPSVRRESTAAVRLLGNITTRCQENKWVCTFLDFPREGGETNVHHWTVSKKKKQLSSWLFELRSTAKSLSPLTWGLKYSQKKSEKGLLLRFSLKGVEKMSFFIPGTTLYKGSLYRGSTT